MMRAHTASALGAVLFLATTLVHVPANVLAQPPIAFWNGSVVQDAAPGSFSPGHFASIDLSDDVVPSVLRDEPKLGPAGIQLYGATYVALANERFEVAAEPRAREDRYLELFGIAPSFSVLRDRLLDDARHACHDAIDVTALRDGARSSEATRVVERRLVCEGLVPLRAVDGVLDPRDRAAIGVYERRHMIVGRRRVEGDTRAAMLESSRELDFRALLRALRERVADALGLIEDGSAIGVRSAVAGRVIDSDALRRSDGAAIAGGAPDLTGEAADVAARELGWTDPESAAAWFRTYAATGSIRVRVALRLPPPPPYHSASMDLRVEIDRGSRRTRRRPTFVLFARHEERDTALVRWPTTVGGVQLERLASGAIVRRNQPSPTGRFYWRTLVTAPSWLPPPSTPDSELLVERGGRVVVPHELFGPSYRSAYGLAMWIHERAVTGRDGTTRYVDTSIRTHGSGSYRSIVDGHSHGCHRLFNHLALRLGAFVLQHRPHSHVGTLPASYIRRVTAHGALATIRIERRGYVEELASPIPVDVLP